MRGGPPDRGGGDARREALAGLDADAWAALLPLARSALDRLPDDPEMPERAALREVSTGRLAGGKGRERLTRSLVEDGELWAALTERLSDDQVPDAVSSLLDVRSPDTVESASLEPDALEAGSFGRRNVGAQARAGAADAGPSQALIDARRRAQRDRERLKEARDALENAKRRTAGAESRAEVATRELAVVREQVAELTARLDALVAAMAEAGSEQRRAVERERRRRDAEVAELTAQLAQMRRAEEQRHIDRRRRDAAREQAQRSAAERASADRREQPSTSRLVPGRPSQLPAEVVPGTREAVEHYLHRGRRVLVDGYNVTLKHQPRLELERQRSWLVQALANLARQRGVVPTVVFDGQRSGGGRSVAGSREVQVRFTAPPITADDDIVLELESTDDPVLVVTDDRELIGRAKGSGADVISTGELLWLL